MVKTNGDERENYPYQQMYSTALFTSPFLLQKNLTPDSGKKTLSRLNVPGLAHGKMYKRYTFGASCPSLRSRFGVLKQKIANHEE